MFFAKKRYQLAFSRLLEWLDNGVDSHGKTYLEMRRRLVSYFDRRSRPTAEDLADETLNRIGRTLERALIIEYYRDARRQEIERRRDRAKRLGITMNALSIRVSRIRATLAASVEICRRERRQM